MLGAHLDARVVERVRTAGSVIWSSHAGCVSLEEAGAFKGPKTNVCDAVLVRCMKKQSMAKLQDLGGVLLRVLRYAFFLKCLVTVRVVSGDSS